MYGSGHSSAGKWNDKHSGNSRAYVCSSLDLESAGSGVNASVGTIMQVIAFIIFLAVVHFLRRKMTEICPSEEEKQEAALRANQVAPGQLSVAPQLPAQQAPAAHVGPAVVRVSAQPTDHSWDFRGGCELPVADGCCGGAATVMARSVNGARSHPDGSGVLLSPGLQQCASSSSLSCSAARLRSRSSCARTRLPIGGVASPSATVDTTRKCRS